MTTHLENIPLLEQSARRGSEMAASALGFLTGSSLKVNSVDSAVVPLEKLIDLDANPEDVVVGVYFTMSGDLDGAMLAYFHFDDAAALIALLTGTTVDSIDDIDELALSCLAESANIIVSKYAAAHEQLCGLSFVPSTPATAIEMKAAVISSAAFLTASTCDEVLILSAELASDSELVCTANCHLLFLPSADSLTRLLGAGIA